MKFEKPSDLGAVLHPALFAITYFVGAEVGHALSVPGNFASFWPPSGLYVAVLLVADVRRWPTFLIAALCANFATDVLCHDKAALVSAGFWFANAVEAVAGAWLLRRFVGAPLTLNRLRNVIGLFTVSALLTPLAGALIGAAVVVAAYGGRYWESWVVWWTSDVIGVVAFTPLLVTVLNDPSVFFRKVRLTRAVEALFLLTCVIIEVEFVFGYRAQPLLWTLLPFMLWTALRFEILGVSLAVVVLTVLMIHNTAQGYGPFAAAWSTIEQMLLVRSFILLATVSFLTLAAALQERRESVKKLMENEAALRDLYENMDDHVLSTGPDGQLLRVNRAC